jgi:urea transporter
VSSTVDTGHLRAAPRRVASFGAAVLKGPAQVVFQENIWTGLLVTAGIALGSVTASVDFLVGAALAAGTAILLKADRKSIKAGIFGFAGGYVGLQVGVYADQGALPGPADVIILVVLASILVVPMTSGLMSVFGRLGISPTALPIILMVWLIMASVVYTDLNRKPVAPPLFPVDQMSSDPYTWQTWVDGIGNGFAQIFSQHEPVGGYVILLAILISSRIAALMGLAGAAMGILVPMLLGFDEAMVRTGTMAYNPALIAIGLGGFFIVFSRRSALYALAGSIVSIWVYIAMSAILNTVGLPAMTSGMAITIALMVLGAQTYEGLHVIPLANLGRPEEHLRSTGD